MKIKMLNKFPMICFRKHVLVINISFLNGSFANLAHRLYYEKAFFADIFAVETQ